MSFPSSPVNGQTALVNGINYAYSTTTGAWSRTISLVNMQIYSGTAPPGTPNVGDQWYNTLTNAVYRWTFDGINYYWVDQTGGSDNFFSSANVLTISSNVDSTNSATGALVVRGGAGVSGNLFVGNVNVKNLGMIQSLIFGF